MEIAFGDLQAHNAMNWSASVSSKNFYPQKPFLGKSFDL
jgi:hypothetical protein